VLPERVPAVRSRPGCAVEGSPRAAAGREENVEKRGSPAVATGPAHGLNANGETLFTQLARRSCYELMPQGSERRSVAQMAWEPKLISRRSG
jgi:hypothetical protein